MIINFMFVSANFFDFFRKWHANKLLSLLVVRLFYFVSVPDFLFCASYLLKMAPGDRSSDRVVTERGESAHIEQN